MVQMREVAERTYLLDCGEVPEFSMPQVAFLLLDDKPVLIEPCCTTAASRLLNDSSRLGLHLENLSYIIPTHIHVDHGGAAGYLARQFPKAKVAVHPRGAGHLKEPSRLIQGTSFVFGPSWEEAFGPILPVPEDQIHVVQDGEVIPLEKRRLTIFFSPGHAPHHIAIHDSLTNGLFCGEALGFVSDSAPDVPLPAGVPPFDPELYLETIDRLAKVSARLLFYSHVGVGNDAEKLIGQVRKTTVAFGEIIQKGVEAGEDDKTILGHLSEYMKRCSPKAELPISFQLTLSGYLDYFRNRK